MNRNKAMFLVLLLLIASIVAAVKLSPKRYKVATTMPEAIVFWNDDDAFVFLSLNTTGRARNAFQEKLEATKYGYLSFVFGNYIAFNKQDVIAYHLAADGRLSRFPLQDGTMLYGSWSLVDGRLQLTPPSTPTENLSFPSTLGFRWDGTKFVPVTSSPQPAKVLADSKLNADDDEDEDADYGFLNQSARTKFKASGWHYKLVTGYSNGSAEATLPITLAGSTFNLTVESGRKKDAAANFDFLAFGAKGIRLSGKKLESGSRGLWSQSGWQPVTKSEYTILNQKYGRHQYQSPFTWTWLTILGFLLLWRLASWFHLLFAFSTIKGRILKNMATSYSFPPATPAQFPALDTQGLDRYTRELEGMGFTRLLDCSLVSDSPTHPANFYRLLTHTRHHCFATISQFFPKGKSPMSLRCGLEVCLQNGWYLGFSNRKPQAASSLMRRKKALRVCMPDVSNSELLQAFLKMREQVCLDLGISPVNDDTLEAFINKTQRAAGELREAVQEKNFIRGLPELYLRKFSLLKTKPEYVWLGDYPREAEQRKQGLSSFATVAR